MRSSRALALTALLVGAGLLPLLLGDYRTFQLTQALIYAIAILGLNILTGYNGQVSLGHGAFYALGAYAAAILMTQGGVAYYWTLPVAGVVGFGAGFLFGFPALRLQGLYLALATFALAVATPQILKSNHLAAWTGGVQGIVILKPDPPAGLPLSPDQWLYCVTLAVLVLLLVGAWNLLHGRSGRAINAIRDNPIAAQAMGVDLALYKTLTFGISAAYTSIAGALGAIVVQFVAPDSFTVFLSITLLVGLVVGGLASIPGAIFGGLFVELLPNLAEQISKAAPWAIYGAFLIAFMYVMPYGIWGLMRTLYQRLRRKSPATRRLRQESAPARNRRSKPWQP
jgi:branched-chain amino acid transport system permease protein